MPSQIYYYHSLGAASLLHHIKASSAAEEVLLHVQFNSQSHPLCKIKRTFGESNQGISERLTRRSSLNFITTTDPFV